MLAPSSGSVVLAQLDFVATTGFSHFLAQLAPSSSFMSWTHFIPMILGFDGTGSNSMVSGLACFVSNYSLITYFQDFNHSSLNPTLQIHFFTLITKN